MAEAKRKQADTNKDKDADINTEVVHDGATIDRYAHHTYIHAYQSKASKQASKQSKAKQSKAKERKGKESKAKEKKGMG